MARGIQLLFSLLIFLSVSGQEKWDILRCVNHALQNNISVRQSDLQTRFSELTYKQNKAGQLPSLNFSGSTGYRLGRSENPTTGILEDNNFLNVGMQLQSGVTLFNWFSRRNNREASRLTWEADKLQVQKVKDDIALNVAVAYLQILLAREQTNVARIQAVQTADQLRSTRIKVDAGALPELNAAELEAQLARDSSSLVSAEATVLQFILQMKALLNLDAGVSFEIETPPVDLIPVEPLADMMPEAVYTMALAALPQQKVNALRILSANKSISAARAGMYPSVSAFGSLADNAIFFKTPIYSQVFSGYNPSGARADAGGGIYYPVEIPKYTAGTDIVGYFRPGSFIRQLNNNFGWTVGIGLSVPIMNGRSARTAWDRSKLNLLQLELQKEQDDMQLKQDIYKAYNDAVAAMQKFNADKKSVQTAEKAFDFAKKRYDLNLLSTYDLINSQNSVTRARIQALYSQYDYVFKMKLLEFYKGQGLKL
ncbi:MAG: TolC family protein [Chitinophagaceae bacterium]